VKGIGIERVKGTGIEREREIERKKIERKRRFSFDSS
jgi:hypothetical protein